VIMDTSKAHLTIKGQSRFTPSKVNLSFMDINLISSRVLTARKHLRLTQSEFGKICGGISKAAVSQWEHGDTTPTLDSLMPLERKKGISSEWILKNKGEMRLSELRGEPDTPSSDRERLINSMEFVLSHDHEDMARLRTVLSRLDQLDKKDFRRLVSMIELFLDNS